MKDTVFDLKIGKVFLWLQFDNTNYGQQNGKVKTYWQQVILSHFLLNKTLFLLNWLQ